MLQGLTSGIPCRFLILPNQLKKVKIIKKRASEIEYSFCKVSCPHQGIIFVKDSKGRVIETLETRKHQYSFLEEFPKLPPFAKREAVLKTEGSRLVMACPG